MTMPETLLGIYIGNYIPEGVGAPERAGILPASYLITILMVQLPPPTSLYFRVQHLYLRVLTLGRT